MKVTLADFEKFLNENGVTMEEVESIQKHPYDMARLIEERPKAVIGTAYTCLAAEYERMRRGFIFWAELSYRWLARVKDIESLTDPDTAAEHAITGGAE